MAWPRPSSRRSRAGASRPAATPPPRPARPRGRAGCRPARPTRGARCRRSPASRATRPRRPAPASRPAWPAPWPAPEPRAARAGRWNQWSRPLALGGLALATAGLGGLAGALLPRLRASRRRGLADGLAERLGVPVGDDLAGGRSPFLRAIRRSGLQAGLSVVLGTSSRGALQAGFPASLRPLGRRPSSCRLAALPPGFVGVRHRLRPRLNSCVSAPRSPSPATAAAPRPAPPLTDRRGLLPWPSALVRLRVPRLTRRVSQHSVAPQPRVRLPLVPD